MDKIKLSYDFGKLNIYTIYKKLKSNSFYNFNRYFKLTRNEQFIKALKL